MGVIDTSFVLITGMFFARIQALLHKGQHGKYSLKTETIFSELSRFLFLELDIHFRKQIIKGD